MTSHSALSWKAGICNAIKPAVVAIGNRTPSPGGGQKLNIMGSGFCVRPSGTIVTCAHVVQSLILTERGSISDIEASGADSYEGKMTTPQVYFFVRTNDLAWTLIAKTATEAFASIKDDIAFIGFDDEPFMSADEPIYPHLQLDPTTRFEGTEVGVVGFPGGEDLHPTLDIPTYSFAFGHIGAVVPSSSGMVHPDSYNLDVLVNGGNSGGPIFDATSGSVVGLLAAGFHHTYFESIKVPMSIAIGVPAWKIQEELARWEESRFREPG